MNYYPYSERKSRRTHKNSRDGCSNCKSRRIKCTEELPECLNCVKKSLKCAYLEYTEEQLEPIRLKNEKKKRKLTIIRHINEKVVVDGSSTRFSRANSQSSYSDSTEVGSVSGSLQTKSDSQHINQKTGTILTPQLRSTESNAESMSQSSTGQHLSNLEAAQSSSFMAHDYSHFTSSSSSSTNLTLEQQQYHFFGSPVSNSTYLQKIDDEDIVSSFGRFNQYANIAAEDTMQDGQIYIPRSSKKMLPSSKYNPVIIQLFKENDKFTSPSSVSLSSSSSIYLSSSDNGFSKHYSCTNTIVSKMMEESFECELHFSCFMVNTLDYMIYIADNAGKENQFVRANKSPQLGFKEDLCIDGNLISTLNSKSMKYYVGLISSLRSSVVDGNCEHPIRTSLFVAWNSLIHKDSSLDTLLIFLNGCSNLVYQSLFNDNYCNSTVLRYVFDMINENLNFTFFLKFKLNFNLLAEYQSFLSQFMKIIDTFVSFQDDNIEYLKISYNLLRLHEFVNKLNVHYIPNIIKTNDIMNGNRKHSNANNSGVSEELFYFNPQFAFEILQNWLQIIPPINSKLDKSNPFHKIYNLFYENLIRLLSSTFPYFKSVLVHDFVQSPKYFEKMNFKNFDFTLESFEDFFDLVGDFASGEFPLAEVKFITNYNLRMINFLNNRAQLLFLYNDLYDIHKLLLNKSKNEFLLKHNDMGKDIGVESGPTSDNNVMDDTCDPTKNVVYLVDNKLGILENQLSNLGNNSIKFGNYPILESINQTIYKSCEPEELAFSIFRYGQSLSDFKENEQHYRSNEGLDRNMLLSFNYDKGICESDTDITKLIRNLSSVTSKGNSQNINIDDKRRIIKLFYNTRTEIMRSISK